jgi:hypothetical protein
MSNFNIGDKVCFGVRASDMRTGRNRADGRNGGILRLEGTIVAYEQYSGKRRDCWVVKHAGGQYERYSARLYNLRELKGGWVVETEHDDAKGRLYMRLNKELEAAE